MPNWVTNNLNIAEKDLEKFKKLALDKNGNIDFNILIPMPNDLNIVAGSYTWDKNKRIYNEKTNRDIYDELYTPEIDKFVKFVLVSNITQEIKETYKTNNREDIVNILKSYYNLRKYGYANWYDWSCDKWGTKWNASETYSSNNHFTFDTAWRCPFKWLEELSKHIDFKGSFADEDLGSNLGTFETENGKLLGGDFDEFSQDELYYIATIIKGNNVEWYEEWLGYNEDLEPISDDTQKEIDEILEEYI